MPGSRDHGPTPGARRVGHVIAAVVNGALLWLIHVRPGWETLGFLTPDTTEVLALVDAALAVGIAVNLLESVWDRPAVERAGSVVTTAVGLAATARVLTVFPFDFPAGFDWALLVRILLIIGLVGTSVALVVAVVSLVRLPGRQDTASR